MNTAIDNLKSGNYEVVDNQGVSVTTHFIECLEKEFFYLEAKFADLEIKYEDRKQFCIIETRSLTQIIFNLLEENSELKQQLAEKKNEKENKNV